MSADSKKRTWRLSQVAGKFNVGTQSIVSFLSSVGYNITGNPNTKITEEQFRALEREFAISAMEKEEASLLNIGTAPEDVVIHPETQSRSTRKIEEKIRIQNLSSTERIAPKPTVAPVEAPPPTSPSKLKGPKVVGKIDIDKKSKASPPKPSVEANAQPSETKTTDDIPKAKPAKEKTSPEIPPTPKKEVLRIRKTAIQGPTVIDKIDIKESAPESEAKTTSKEKRKRPRRRLAPPALSLGPVQKPEKKSETEGLSTQEIKENIKATLAKMSQSHAPTPAKSKLRKEKRSSRSQAEEQESTQEAKILQTTAFVSVNDLAALMSINVNDLISTCMQMGMFVSINQRLDSEAITVLADEYGYEVQFSTPEEEQPVDNNEDLPDDTTRAPIITIMGHVDHGKTSLLDFIRSTTVTTAEAGGITQHIGAYEVSTQKGRNIVFLDTPGHAAFTAMRARGASLTDVAVIIVAADDNVMPQTKEAINHVKIASVPFLVAINKVDKADSDPEKIREQLSKFNVLVEEWGGKIQSQEVSAKTGQGIDQLLEKLLLEADLLELKANPQKSPTGSVIEASLDKGRGYVTNLLVQNGTLKIGDALLAGLHAGKIKAMFDHLGKPIKTAGPSTPVQILGLDGPPQAGDKFKVLKNEREAREIANKRQQIARQQSIRTQKHITLDEIGRRLALGSFKELNILIKGDVDGSVEALADALLKLSTEEVQVNIIHKGVGQISESDVLLATAADAIIIGFQVRPSEQAKTLSEKEQIEIRLYSVIFDAINEIKDAIKGMHAPKIEEITTATLEVRKIFKLPKIGTVAGCIVKEGTLNRAHTLRIIRDGTVIHQGTLNQLKRFKDDVNEVKENYECGLSLKNYHDIQIGDLIEGFTKQEIQITHPKE